MKHYSESQSRWKEWIDARDKLTRREDIATVIMLLFAASVCLGALSAA